MCQACQEGKQHRKTTGGHKTTKMNEGVLSKGKLELGDLVFSDQYESSLPGRYYNNRGSMSTHHTYGGGTIFYDAASRYISIHNQVGFTAEETIESKLAFEKDGYSVGIKIKKYCTDNRVYVSKAILSIFMIWVSQYN